MIKVLRAKFHGIRVTGADLNYHGSITLDPELCRMAGFYPTEFVEIWSKATGARFSTYVIHGKPGSRCCILNGAAARLVSAGDEIIIAASSYVQPVELNQIKPTILTFKDGNEVDEVLHYEVFETPEDPHAFRIVDGSREDAA